MIRSTSELTNEELCEGCPVQLVGFLSKVIDVLRVRGLHIEALTEVKR